MCVEVCVWLFCSSLVSFEHGLMKVNTDGLVKWQFYRSTSQIGGCRLICHLKLLWFLLPSDSCRALMERGRSFSYSVKQLWTTDTGCPQFTVHIDECRLVYQHSCVEQVIFYADFNASTGWGVLSSMSLLSSIIVFVSNTFALVDKTIDWHQH